MKIHKCFVAVVQLRGSYPTIRNGGEGPSHYRLGL